MIKIKEGLDLPITGSPNQTISKGPDIRTVAVLGDDFVGMKPTMEVKVGDRVKCGQVLFSNKKSPSLKYTAPASGTVTAINRGHKRVLQSVVIRVEGSDAVEFKKYSRSSLSQLKKQEIIDNLVSSGLWASLRVRPFSKSPEPDQEPAALFVTAMDTNPLAADPSVVIKEFQQDFLDGLAVVSQLTAGKTYLCSEDGANTPGDSVSGVVGQKFSGPHPAGLVGTHIHFLHPVSAKRTVWHIGYQDVIAVGQLFTTGKLNCQRVVSLAGPQVKNPTLLRTRLGASLEELTHGQLLPGENRIVSGSVLSGRTAAGPLGFLGRYHTQVSVLEEGRQREFLGWQSPGVNKFSVKNIYLSKLMPGKKFPFTTSSEGSPRAMVPIGMYEKVMPLDIEPTFLLRSLISNDTAQAQLLGALELDEEDLALCSLVCPGKTAYGPILRKNLTTIAEEG